VLTSLSIIERWLLARSWSDIFAVFFADLYDDLRDKQDNSYKLSMRFYVLSQDKLWDCGCGGRVKWLNYDETAPD